MVLSQSTISLNVALAESKKWVLVQHYACLGQVTQLKISMFPKAPFHNANSKHFK